MFKLYFFVCLIHFIIFTTVCSLSNFTIIITFCCYLYQCEYSNENQTTQYFKRIVIIVLISLVVFSIRWLSPMDKFQVCYSLCCVHYLNYLEVVQSQQPEIQRYCNYISNQLFIDYVHIFISDQGISVEYSYIWEEKIF